jgi:hypothetical protein
MSAGLNWLRIGLKGSVSFLMATDLQVPIKEGIS